MWSATERYSAIRRLKRRGWVSLRGAAIILNITYVTALSWLKKGDLEYVDVGGIHRIYPKTLYKALTNRDTVPGDESITAYLERHITATETVT